jgi:hypothetical protein
VVFRSEVLFLLKGDPDMMYTSILAVALTGLSVPAESATVASWSHDYTSARKQAVADKKPLAVFLAPGTGGWDKIGRDGGLSTEAHRLLVRHYTCVHVDTATSAGKALAEAFEISGGLGIVISDRTGDIQAFRHEGDLANQDLVRYLNKYSDPNRVARATESNPGREPAPISYPYAAPNYFPAGGGFASPRCKT